ncbi:Glu/Leu/Phe/Val dehydrogenase dimerization domain-containing protein [Chelatococcus sp. SYSU_G07232]|uniref:Glu/Leu/Phe/Val dehydrogenase dimerization domain-containing protein n=1 Tax=Chelatococcus albus TaxID=3047466 RepID=A0ABT7AGQ8_9HYPH|nr:Glu/Leu/Phe/Val dehydrogenase dimerization domain-containing protein [Chelatococcus sp. SYSU_G07232]MDJ1158182.1 Glu/Leu/Phe/Val dehydrogenase dimerization domain-containing protein [Chelatococcus sp. SYSU_G07232]
MEERPVLFSSQAFRDHEEVVFFREPASGLKAIVAVHSTAAGPACGGTRFHAYASEQEAIDDVLRLSAAMSLKSALAGLPLGGGKSVIIGDPERDKTPALLEAFGRALDRLGGRYVAAEDVGMSPQDLQIVARATRHVAGLPAGPAASGDPSPLTARGVLRGIEAAARFKLGRETLRGVRVGILGLGHVGSALARLLHQAGAELVVADIMPAPCEEFARLGARVVEVEAIVAEPLDVFAPCALGGILNEVTVERLQAPIVAGAANNQLASDAQAVRLFERGVLYAPDFAINAGGIINVAGEIAGSYHRDEVLTRVDAIGETLRAIFMRAERERRSPHFVALAMAEERLDAARKLRVESGARAA